MRNDKAMAGVPDGAPATRASGTGKRMALVVLLPLVAVVGVFAAERVAQQDTFPAEARLMTAQPGFGSPDFGAEMAAAERQLGLNRERVANGPEEWLRREGLARANLSRFKLTAEIDDLEAAIGEMERARALAPEGTGPLLSSAELAMAGHDLDAVEHYVSDLANTAVPPPKAAQAEAIALRGDVAFYRGDMNAAAARYREAEQVNPSAGISIRLAMLAKSQARFDEAISHVEAAARRDTHRTPRALASYALQIGMIESARGNHTDARQWYQRADGLFPGYWLTQLYLAEAMAVAGEAGDALEIYETVAEQTGDPQALDALAFLLADLGQADRSRGLSRRAAGIWREHVDRLPLAYIAHAFENELAFGDPARALELARQNLAHRPYGDAHILVAEALLATRQPAAARSHLLQAEALGWRSAPLYARLSEAEEELGDMDAAREARNRALEINPTIFSPTVNRLWFGHG